MSIGWLFFGGLSTAVTVALAWWSRSLTRENAVMTRLPTSAARDVANMPPGTHVELKGILRCDAPLRAEFTGTECAWYCSRIDEHRMEEDSDGKKDRRKVEVYRGEKWAPCTIVDATGQVALVGQIAKFGAKIEGTQVRDMETTSFPSSVGALAGSILGGSTFRCTQIEHVLALNSQVYVLATVLAGGGVGADVNGRNLFLVSTNSEEERTAGNASIAKWARRIAVAGAALSVGLLYQWVVRR